MKKQNIFIYYFLYFIFVWVILFGLMWGVTPQVLADIPVVERQLTQKELELRRLSTKNFTVEQIDILMKAYDIGIKDGLQPELIQGILIQESKAGDAKLNKFTPYHGVAQIHLDAAKDVFQLHPELLSEFNMKGKSDKAIINKLASDNEFNISVASKYLLMIKSMGYNTLRQMAMAYNVGPYGAKKKNASTHGYANKVMAHINKIK